MQNWGLAEILPGIVEIFRSLVTATLFVEQKPTIKIYY